MQSCKESYGDGGKCKTRGKQFAITIQIKIPMNPIFTITIDIYPNGDVVTWEQKKENLTEKQAHQATKLIKEVKNFLKSTDNARTIKTQIPIVHTEQMEYSEHDGSELQKDSK